MPDEINISEDEIGSPEIIDPPRDWNIEPDGPLGTDSLGSPWAPGIYKLLKGAWVTSYMGFAEVLEPVQSSSAPPSIGGYRFNTANQRGPGESFFITNGVFYFVFDGMGHLEGFRVQNRGNAKEKKDFVIAGTYEVSRYTHAFGPPVFSGYIRTSFSPRQDQIMKYDYYFVMRNRNELEWFWVPQPFDETPGAVQDRFLISSGTMKRIEPMGFTQRFLARLGIR